MEGSERALIEVGSERKGAGLLCEGGEGSVSDEQRDYDGERLITNSYRPQAGPA